MPDTFSNVINPNVPGLDASLTTGQRVTTRTSAFLFNASQGAIIAALVDPFGSGSTFSTVGTVPPQLALSGGNIVKGSAAGVPGTEYKIRVLASSADGLRDTSAILSFTAKSELPPVIVTPTPTPTPTLTLSSPSPSIASNAASGTLVSNISNVPAGATPTVTPNDGRLVIAGDSSAGWKVVVGMSALSAGTVSFSVAATGATGADGVLTVTAAAIPLAVMFVGSSTPDKYFDTFSGPANDQVFRSTNGSTYTAFGTSGAGGAYFGDYLQKNTGRPARLIGKGTSGTRLTEWEVAGSTLRASAVSAAKAAIIANGVENFAIVSIVGFNDVLLDSNVVSQAAHEALLRSFLSKLRSEIGANVPILIGVSQAMTREAPTAEQETQLTYVRAAEMAVSKDANNGFYAHSLDLPTITNDFHLTAAGYNAHANRGAKNVAARFGFGTATRGPSIVSAVGVDYTTTDVTIVHDGGTDFTPTSGISGFRVSFDDFATSVVPTAVARTSATKIRLSHANSGGAAARVAHLRGALPNVTAPVEDNQTPQFNLNPTETFITATAPPVPTTPGFTDTFTDVDGTLLTAHASDSPNTATYTNDSATFAIYNGRARGGARPAQVANTYSPASANYDVLVDMVVLSVLANANEYIVFRRAGASSYMVAGLTGMNRWEIGITNTSYVALVSATFTPVAGTTYKLKMEVRGNDFTFYVDDVVVATINNTALPNAGRVGLRSSGSGTNNSSTTGVHFDNLKLIER